MSRKFIAKAPALLAIALMLAGGLSLWGCRSQDSTSNTAAAAADVPPLAARVDRLDGDVGTTNQPQDGQTAQSGQTAQGGETAPATWVKASVNSPVSVGTRVYVKSGSHTAIAFSGRNYARLNPDTSCDVLALSQRRTQLALRSGSGVFDVGALAPDELFEVATPDGAIDFDKPGLYQVAIGDDGNAQCSVLAGSAHFVGQAGTGECHQRQLVTLSSDISEDAYVSDLDPGVCGQVVDDYYSYRYPDTYDGRYKDYNTYLDDPTYYDPYRRSVSHQYIPDDAEVAGLDDLDSYGDWQDVPNYGHCWRPRETAGWAPYRDGSWHDDNTLGLTWVANERWGWAPYHYGRWVDQNQQWYWVPGDVVSHPVYSPALVAFVSLPQQDRVGWVPLGPGDPYVPRYYDRNYQPQYIGSRIDIDRNVNVTTVVNYNVPGAVTIVPSAEFSRAITPGIALAADAAMLARARPVMDPFAVPRVREMAPTIQASRPAVQVPIAVVQQAYSRPVVTSQNPVVPAVAAANIKAMNVQPVPEAAAKRKLQVKNTGQVVATTQPNGPPIPIAPPVQRNQGQNQAGNQAGNQAPNQPPNQNMSTQERQARIAALSAQAAQGNKAAKQEVRQLQEQQRVQDKMDRKTAAQQAAGQPAQQGQQQAAQQAQQRKAEKQAAQQAAQQQQQQAAQQAAQQAQQRKAQKQAAQQAAQQQQQQAAQQQAQQAQQSKAQKQAAQQQQQQAAQQQAQQAEQRRAQKQAAQQAAQQQQQQAAQQAAQRKAERQAAQQKAQQAAQQQQQQAAQQAAQRKAERQAAQQKAQQAAQQQQQQAAQQAAQRKAERQAAQQQAQQAAQQKQQQAQQAAQQRQQQQQQAAQQAAQRKAERQAAQQQAQQAAQQKQQQAQQAAQQRQQQRAQRQAQQQQQQQQQAPGENPKKKNKNRNSSQ